MNLKYLTPEQVKQQLNEQVDLQDMNRVMLQLTTTDRDNFNKAVKKMKKVIEDNGFDKKETKEIFIFLLDALL